MESIPQGGYMGKVSRVDLTEQQIKEENIDEAILRKYLGGTGIGAKYLYEEVPPGVKWSDPDNRLIWFTGPISGTSVAGSGLISVLGKGPMTNMAGASQANGFFGAFIKHCGFDGLIVQGASERWVYILISDGKVELRDANHLLGKNTRETEDIIKQELGIRCSVFTIGPAGENLVRFACIVGDHGHVIGHNGLGAVMGSKKLKAIVAARGNQRVPIKDRDRTKQCATQLFETSKTKGAGAIVYKWGTAGTYPIMYKGGVLPIKNYTASTFPEHERFSGEYLRSHFKVKWTPCWACRMKHCHEMEITEGPYKGLVGEEPEYEGLAATSSLIGNTDPAGSVMLANLIDWLGIDINETGYLLGWVMECYEKGLLTKDDLDGLEMNWGNVEASAELLRKTANRKGYGNFLAEGVKREAERIGGEALSCAVYTLKGASPRGHDHRARWNELIDTCLSNTGTIEATGGTVPVNQIGLSPVEPFDPEEMSTRNAEQNGWRQFEDSICICRFCHYDLQEGINTLNAITGWDFTIPEAMDAGRRVVNQLRLFNFRHGLTKDIEAPSQRYSSAAHVDGPAKGISIQPHWDLIRSNYYKQMGWDPETGKPLPKTLQKLGLDHLIHDLNLHD